MNKKFMVHSLWFIAVLVFFLFLPLTTNHQLLTIYAQTKGIEVTQTFSISDTDVVEGDIVSNTESGIIRSKLSYDNRILGVVQTNPLVVFRDINKEELPVVRQGTAYINVTNLNGNINKGDFITSSEIPGKGQKAILSGYVLGTALEPLAATASTQISYNNREYSSGQVPVALRIEYASITGTRFPSQLLEQIITGLLKNIVSQDQLVQLIKYLIALLVFVSTLIFSFLTFSKVITKGIEGLGRNPLARNSIQLSIILNIIMVIVITFLGLAATILIIRL